MPRVRLLPRRKLLVVLCLVAELSGASFALAAEAPQEDPILVGAGGIASCDTAGDEATAALIDKLPESATVFAAGDNAYEKGTSSQFAKCYDKTWGRFKDRTRPVPGNHDYATKSGGPYYSYFGDAAGEAGKGWYSYDVGDWHIVSLNSNCKSSSKCARGSAQERWLRADLAASDARCTAAVMHHPRFSSDNVDGSQKFVDPLWDALYDAGADLVISGHARVYERFAPQTPEGRADPEHGLTLFNVGTGGRGHANFRSKPVANSVVRDRSSWGVLKLTLHPDSYDFAFLPVAGAKFTDSGRKSCHGKPGGDEPPPEEPPAGDTVRFGAAADASVIKSSPAKNFGSDGRLLTDADPAKGAHLRFTVSGVEGTVTRARLRLWASNGSGNGPSVYPTDADPPWSESAITWNQRPARTGPALDDVGKVSAGQYVEYDVTDAVAGNGAYSFELATNSGDGTDFSSSEASNADQRPSLILDVTPPEEPPPPPVEEPPPPVEEDPPPPLVEEPPAPVDEPTAT